MGLLIKAASFCQCPEASSALVCVEQVTESTNWEPVLKLCERRLARQQTKG